MNGPINSGLLTADPTGAHYDARDYPAPERVMFVYPRRAVRVPRREVLPSGRVAIAGNSVGLTPWRGVVTFEPVALRDFDLYVKRAGEIAGYISMVPSVHGYQYGWALTDNAGNLIWLAVDKRDCQRHAISHLPSAAEQEAYRAENVLAARFLDAAE